VDAQQALGPHGPAQAQRRVRRVVNSITGGGGGILSGDCRTDVQGLTLVHFSAQLEPCLKHKRTLHTLNTPQHPLNTGYTTPRRTPYHVESAQVELRSERV
jgi:hypothetical protein